MGLCNRGNCHYYVSMSRENRLYKLIQIIKNGRLHRAKDLAAQVGVSLRTLYRDMDTLAASGVPVRGERGVGYQITAAYTLPALNLTKAELEALHLGLAAVGASEDSELANAAKALSHRIDGVLPEERNESQSGWRFAAYPFANATRGFEFIAMLRKAIRNRQKLHIEHEEAGICDLRPLALDYWGRLWTLTAWNETADDFCTLRVDLIIQTRPLPAIYVDEPGKTLKDYNRINSL